MVTETIRTGYKQTEVGIIPEDWTVKKLGELLDYEQPTEYLVKNTEYNDHYDTPVLTAGKTFVLGFTNESIGIFQNIPVIIFDDFTTANKFVTFPFKAKSSAMKMLKPKTDGVNLKFVFERIQLINFKLGDHKRYWISEYQHLKIATPKYEEQSAIEKILSDTDELIRQLYYLITKKKNIKQGAMQELLTGKIRLSGFSGEWKKVQIGDHFDFKNGLNKAKEFFGQGTPIINYMDVYPHLAIYAKNIHGKVTLSNNELRAFEVRKGDVLFTRTSETIEEIGLSSIVLDDVENTVFSGFLLRAKPKTKLFESQFKKYCFRSNAVRKQIISTSSQTTRALTNGRLLSKVSVLIPINPQEQIAIAETISDMDLEIKELETKKDKYVMIKNGMMQKLLTGEIRVK